MVPSHYTFYAPRIQKIKAISQQTWKILVTLQTSFIWRSLPPPALSLPMRCHAFDITLGCKTESVLCHLHQLKGFSEINLRIETNKTLDSILCGHITNEQNQLEEAYHLDLKRARLQAIERSGCTLIILPFDG